MVKKHNINTFKLFCVLVNEKYNGKRPIDIFERAARTVIFGHDNLRFRRTHNVVGCVMARVVVFSFRDGDIYYQTYSGQYEIIYIDINKYIEDIV